MYPNTETLTPQQATAHLTPELWQIVTRDYLCKMICEFSHEMLLKPITISAHHAHNRYRLEVAGQNIVYYFEARLLALDHLLIDPSSIRKETNGIATEPDAISFLIEHKAVLGLEEGDIGTYIEEVISCMQGSAYKYQNNQVTSETLATADYQEVEHAMTAGHPCFIANSARIGFDASDYQNYAPEAAEPFGVVWLAGHKSRTAFTTMPGFSYEQVIRQELDQALQEQFDTVMESKGLDKTQYYWFPVHPWQWYHKLTHIFAADIATGLLVCLGASTDRYLPQQSVRTLFNVSHTGRYYVKSALSILNMGFMRGLSPYFMRTTPGINQWVYALVQQDAYLQEKQFTMLRECATIGYTHRAFETALQQDSPYKKMLATLWRESPIPLLQPGQQLVTMAALLHVDASGNALLKALITRSGLDTGTWLQHYFDCYLSPLIHCYYYHDMRFMPHGENLILVLEQGKPVKAIMKDIGEEVAIVSPDKPLPEDIERIRIQAPEEFRLLSIFTQIFDCFFRFLNEVLVAHLDYPEEQFWGLAADCIRAYQARYPELEEKFRKFDLFTAEIPKTCLNRLQIRNSKKMIDMAAPFRNQHFAGVLKNPLSTNKAAFA
ncbi:IucA/IucC family protein [Taibaiella koreensis]|uniref:IucA/IucC family protein n=1 Tax=Taibaiella koreensis TaxID=1268548 RepID=UPI000E599953|nr:IucA/IucC family siderophore biosynthesis protein [Taibaiella koreensis]